MSQQNIHYKGETFVSLNTYHRIGNSELHNDYKTHTQGIAGKAPLFPQETLFIGRRQAQTWLDEKICLCWIAGPKDFTEDKTKMPWAQQMARSRAPFIQAVIKLLLEKDMDSLLNLLISKEIANGPYMEEESHVFPCSTRTPGLQT